MKVFWEEIIKPLFEKLNVKNIVEIGAQYGGNTRNLLDYCIKVEGDLTVIDPFPEFDETVLKHKNSLTILEGFSLKVLHQLSNYNAVLIDGDHNWYTVYNELKTIERESERFPIVFLHDIEWPYGRRDMYYFPESIPKKYRNPYAKKGIAPGIKNLIEPGNEQEFDNVINKHLNNAIFEGGERNGVLTAVEDFLNESPLNLTFSKIQSNHGLGILTSEENYPFVKEVLGKSKIK